MANMIARGIQRTIPQLNYEVIGDFTHNIAQDQHGEMYQGPEWFTKGMNEGIVFGVIRKA
jgi:hypothetical protein